MKTKKVTYLLVSSIVWFGLLLTPFQAVIAQEGAAGGGAVQTNGEIGFYEGESTTEPPTSSSTTNVSESTIATTKPKGRFPSTGELVKKSLSISGVALVVIVCLLLLFKRKKKEGEE
ncbi:LPXTG cell wall anchor domain-containing protein [Enterococcus ureilyticus]|uniref:LPXTG cell wall anchor domain-containing protein n=1 Tax=Enterococcus ureilyticus TaxID=1131292 RepID=UPI001A921FBC|nr:LPXTG cell wall anchor domain-containing protein [Enterococcus ureilyticus]MBO0445097.1 LPXTG cell wall anchor domain-containing protein [Enterococcus ureilyticus]